MNIRSIRRITADCNHNAFTGVQWFKGTLYVAFRQGDAHVCENGKLVVMRSRDEGAHFDVVAVLRGVHDTRDAHLYCAGDRLFVTGFEYNSSKADSSHRDDHGKLSASGTAWTDNGINWSPWTRCAGADSFVLWRPRYFKGRYYCAGYSGSRLTSKICWFESQDGVNWKNIRVLLEGPDWPNECALDFKPDGTAAMVIRRVIRPLFMQARPPYDKWSEVELDTFNLGGPALWFAGDDVWISGRWNLSPGVRHLAVYKIVDGKPVLRLVLPSGGGDFGYMGVARHPDNPRRFALSYYSSHLGCWNYAADPRPDIYLADIEFEPPFIEKWKVSEVQSGQLRAARCPDPSDSRLQWREMLCAKDTDSSGTVGFADAHNRIAGRPGIIYFVSDFETGSCDRGDLYLGYDGPIMVWVNGEKVFAGDGDNPAVPDKTRVAVTLKHGQNRIAIALDTHDGKAWGIFARYEPAQTE